MSFEKFIDLDKLQILIKKLGFKATICEWKEAAIEIERQNSSELVSISQIANEIPTEEFNIDKVVFLLKEIYEVLSTEESKSLLLAVCAPGARKQ